MFNKPSIRQNSDVGQQAIAPDVANKNNDAKKFVSNITPTQNIIKEIVAKQSNQPTIEQPHKSQIFESIHDSSHGARASASRNKAAVKLSAIRNSANYKTYSDVTGLSETKPQIVLVTDYNALYDSQGNKTKYCDFINLQQQLQSLYRENVDRLYADLVALDPTLAENELQLAADSNIFEAYQTVLNRLTIQLYKFINSHDFRQSDSRESENAFDLIKNAYSNLGYSSQVIDEYSNTKLLLQLFIEHKNNMLGFSNSLNNRATSQKRYTKDPYVLADYNVNDSIVYKICKIQSPNLNDLLQGNASLDDTTKVLSKLFADVESVFLGATPVKKIATLQNYLVREELYSAALGNDQIRQMLKTAYNYDVNDAGTNFHLFDAVFGNFGKSVTDVVKNENAALASICHILDGDNISVLPFELDYIEQGSESVFTPGHEYFLHTLFDENGSLQFKNCKSYYDKLELIINAYSLLAKKIVPESQVRTNNGTTNHTPNVLLKSCNSGFFEDDEIYDLTGEFSQVRVNDAIYNDKLLAIIHFASKSKKLKSLFFLLVLHMIKDKIPAISSLNIPASMSSVISQIAEEVVNYIDMSGINADKSSVVSAIAQSIEAVYHGGEFHENSIIRKFEDVMQSQFSTIENALNSSNRTLYSDVSDTLYLALIFEMFMTYCDQFITGIDIKAAQASIQGYDQNSDPPLYQGIASVVSYTVENIRNDDVVSNIVEIQKINSSETSLFGLLDSCVFYTLSNIRKQCKLLLDVKFDESFMKSYEMVRSLLSRSEDMKFIVDKQQAAVAVSQFTNYRSILDGKFHDEYNDNSSRSILDMNYICDDNTYRGLLAVCSQAELLENKAFNAKIISVGIPTGYATMLRYKVSPETTKLGYKSYSHNFVNVVIHKMNLAYPHIAYKTKKYPFGLSFFVGPIDQFKKIDVSDSLSGDSEKTSLLAKMALKDYNIQNIISQISYVTSENGFEISKTAYDFVKNETFISIAKNHVKSFMLSKYMQLMTGINLHEQYFAVDRVFEKQFDDTKFKRLVELCAEQITKKKYSYDEIVSSESQLTDDQKKSVLFTIRSFSGMQNFMSVLSDSAAVYKTLLKPKEFDRIFNIVVDSDDFELDIRKMQETLAGQETLLKLIKQQKIYLNDSVIEQLDDLFTEQSYKMKEQIKDEELAFEQYFITLEPLSENEK